MTSLHFVVVLMIVLTVAFVWGASKLLFDLAEYFRKREPEPHFTDLSKGTEFYNSEEQRLSEELEQATKEAMDRLNNLNDDIDIALEDAIEKPEPKFDMFACVHPAIAKVNLIKGKEFYEFDFDTLDVVDHEEPLYVVTKITWHNGILEFPQFQGLPLPLYYQGYVYEFDEGVQIEELLVEEEPYDVD